MEKGNEMSKSTTEAIRTGKRFFLLQLFVLSLSGVTLFAASQDEFQRLSPSIQQLLDIHDVDAWEVKSIQSVFDFRNLSGAASAVYETKWATGLSLDARVVNGHPFMPGSAYRGQYGPRGGVCGLFPGRTELWGTFLYNNVAGAGLTSGHFQYGYTNNLYGFTFGIDKTNGGERIGIMGTAGWSNVRSYGDIADTKNDTGFGGVYVYLNERFGNANLFVNTGWLGMNNDIAQFHDDSDVLSGRMDNGIWSIAATLSQLFCAGGLHITPSIGIEYGYYYQRRMDVGWDGGGTVFRHDASNANLVTIPVGIRLCRDMRMYNGTLRPEIRLRYIANVADVGINGDTWYVESDIPASMRSAITDRHAGDAGIGIGWTEGMVTICGNYGFLFSEHRHNHFVSLTGLWKF